MARKPLSAISLLVFLAAIAGCAKGDAPAAAATPTPADEPPTAAAHAPVLPGGALPGAAAPGASAAPPFDVGTLPAVVARVDGAAISKAELLERANAMRAQMQQMGAPPPPASAEFYRAMVDQLIGSKLLVAEAKKRGMMPSDAEVTASVDRLKARGPQELARQLAAQGITEAELRADMAQNLAIQKLVTTEVAPAVKVSEEEARRFYQQNPERMRRPEQVRVRHVLINVPKGATAPQKQEARQKAEALLARIKGGEDFAAVARESSEDAGSRGEGGLLPWLARSESVPAFEQAAFGLKPGETSVVETPFGFHVMRLEEKRPAGTVAFEDVRPQIEQWLSRQQARDLLDRKVAALRKGAKVEVLF
jgi:peptidyl-prolyl cis-trans isomerase C